MEAPLYSKITLLARQMNLLLLGTFHQRQGDQYLLDDDGAAWGRLIGAGLDQKFTGPLAPSFSGTIGAAQLGSDLYVFDKRQNRLGAFLSFAHASGTVRGTILDIATQVGGSLPTDAYNLGGYFTHIGENGWYLDAVLMGTWFRSYPRSLRDVGTHAGGSSVTASLEGAYPFKLDEQWTLEPMAQIVFNRMGFDSTSDPYTTLDFRPADTWFGRIGARVEYNTDLDGLPVKPFVEGNLWHGFGGTDTTIYDGDIPVAVPFGNTDFEIAAGLSSRVSDDVSLHLRLGYTTSIEGNYQQVIQGQIGLRYTW
jgi:autotransporter family porin